MRFRLALHNNLSTLANVNHNRSQTIVFLAICVLGSRAWGQATDARVEQARMRVSPVGLNLGTQDETAAAQRDRVVATPGDSDLGKQIVLPLTESAHPWRLFASAADYYTDNATFTRTNRQADGYFFSEVGARYEGKLTESLGFETTIRQGFFRYHDLTAQDFNSLNAGSGLYYRLKELWNITVFGRYNFEWLTDSGAGRDLLTNHTLSVGAQKTFTFDGGNFIYVGYTSIFGFAEQSALQRNEHVLYGGAQAHLTRDLDADFYARLALFDYRQGNRRDVNGTVVAALTYHLNKRLSVNASYSFVFDRANQSRFDYDAGTVGGGLAFRYDF